MKILTTALTITLLTGCSTYTSQDKWRDWSTAHACEMTGRSKILLAGSVYSTPQRRKVYEFKCDTGIVWSDLGRYAKHNEWLTL